MTVDSDQPLFVKEILPESCNMKKTFITDEWDYKNAGGCANFGMFDKNPAYALNIPIDSEV